jgi:CRISPR-associated protein Cmr3
MTGCYQYLDCSAFDPNLIAHIQDWGIEKMLREAPSATTSSAKLQREEWSNEEWALSYLGALNSYRADDYDDWVTVGMALHSVSDSLLSKWDDWSRQSSKYKPKDCEKKWQSFKGQGLAIGTLAHMAKQDGWRSPFKTSGRGYGSSMGGGGGGRGNGGFGGGGGSGGDGGDGKQPLAEVSLRDRTLEILNRNQDRSERDEAFIRLAKTTGVTTREIKELATSLESEVDLEESRSDRKAEIENLLRIGNYSLTLQDYLDPSVALPLERVGGWMGTTPAAMLTTLYPVIGSLLKVGTRLELIKGTDHYALPVVYTGLVCESGAGKTPAQKTILKPIFALQDEAEIEYKERLLDYQQELSKWKKLKDNDEPAPEQPVPQEYYTTDATSEAIALIQSQQPNEGFLGWFDELPALFKSQGQYKNGRGADGEKILSDRDGTGFKVNRASGKRLVVNQSAYSITGSLQPLILRQMMGDFTDTNGQWARFLWTVMQVQPAPYPDDAIPFDVSGLLKGIYKRLRNLPPITYTLSSQAKKLYRSWYNELDRLKMAESRQGFRAVYSKMKGDTGVLALLLHCFNGCVAEGSTPALEVDAATMAAAIKLSKYHIGQVKLIHSEGDVANGVVAAIHAKIIQLSERKGWLKAADVRDIDRQTKKQFSANDIRRHFQELETSGFGQTKGESTKLMWSIYKEDNLPPGSKNSVRTQDSSGQETNNTESITISCVQPFVENKCCQTQDNSGQTQDNCKTPGSITTTGIQLTENETQDIQDSFAAQDPPLVEQKKSGNKINDAAPTFDVLSCPELASESQNLTAVGIPVQDSFRTTVLKLS